MTVIWNHHRNAFNIIMSTTGMPNIGLLFREMAFDILRILRRKNSKRFDQ